MCHARTIWGIVVSGFTIARRDAAKLPLSYYEAVTAPEVSRDSSSRADSQPLSAAPAKARIDKVRASHGDLRLRWHLQWLVGIRKVLGTLLALNFAIFWAVPVVVQGQSFRRGLDRILRPIYQLVDGSSALRSFAARHIYRRRVHVDYFAASVLLTISTLLLLSAMFSWQIAFGSLPWWLVAIYYFQWVGPGGRSMATAYSIAHREGHLSGGRMYRAWIGERIGNFFENWLGVFYGTVPYNFSTSHILLHHRLNGGKGDSVYLWDLDRTKFGDLMLYQWRLFRYMAGIGSLVEFRRQRGLNPAIDRASATLRRGMAIYWICVPTCILTLLLGTGSSVASALLFVLLVYLQPLLAMSTFLAIINIGQHGFLEFDDEGRRVKHVASITIVDGHEDSFGEDYHVAHHHFPSVQHDKLAGHVASERSEWARCHGAVFEKTTIVEVALMINFSQFDRLIREHYVDFAGDLSADELAALFERRAKRREMSYEEYEFRYLPGLRQRVGELVRRGTCGGENRAYVYQAHCNLQCDLTVSNA